MKKRLDEEMVTRGLVQSRSQAMRLIRMGKVKLASQIASKPSQLAFKNNSIEIINNEKYVSRAGFKLASVSEKLNLDFKDKVVLDVGSSTGGFTDYALQHEAKKIIAVDVGSNQLHTSLRSNTKIELHEKTDIRNFVTKEKLDIVLIDVSFVSLRKILPYIYKTSRSDTKVIAMLKPQFEAGEKLKNKGVIKNDTIRRRILKEFETWVKQYYSIEAKADSEISGSKGNLERFYKLRKMRN